MTAKNHDDVTVKLSFELLDGECHFHPVGHLWEIFNYQLNS